MIYDILAPHYDAFNKDIDYHAWADFVERVFEKYAKKKPELVLDLGAGTGSLTIPLAERGYDMIGVDLSPCMLDIARERAEKSGASDRILWLMQDMREFELYGTVDAALCALDGINHLTSREDLKKCLSLVHNYLSPDGLFIFDINAKGKFESAFLDKTYAYDDGESFCVWQNYYNQKSRLCHFYITLFHNTKNGLYERYEDCQSERMYTVRQIKNALFSAGFELLCISSDLDFSEGDDGSERLYFIARCKKEEK